MSAAVLVLTRIRDAQPLPPEQMPIGRAALALREEGVQVVFGQSVVGGCATGFAAVPGSWVRVDDVRVAAAHDRFQSQTWPAPFLRAVEGLGACPLGNPPSLTLLCRDKLASQRVLEAGGIRMPAVEGDPSRFASSLCSWGAAFLKPRHGAMGRGVFRVEPGDPLPARGPGARRGEDDDLILQRAVPPPDGLGGLAVRALFQREVEGRWISAMPVARSSALDPVANVARGASAGAGDRLLVDSTRAAIEDRGQAICRVLSAQPDGEYLVELGLDFAIDPAGVPHLIEVNSRPRGRLEALAGQEDRFRDLHVEACARPLRRLARLGGLL